MLTCLLFRCILVWSGFAPITDAQSGRSPVVDGGGVEGVLEAGGGPAGGDLAVGDGEGLECTGEAEPDPHVKLEGKLQQLQPEESKAVPAPHVI